ncbi:DNA adenine methylase [Dongia deserti]|uniref:DNA adenine methylase n=1 Tax=Dongia deserti TaxID=2268030 RepID=UPI000E65DD89|nr:DNA adenine methylase [Dongia deserti]
MKSFREVEPALPVAPYVGGKRNLADRLIKRIERIPHSVYAEPFVGMGGVFLRRRSAPSVEIINDRSKDVATLFRVVQRHYVPFTEMIRWQLTTRADFERLSKTDPETLTDLERSARFLYLQRTAFGGKVSGRNFGVSFQHAARFDLARVLPMLEALHERLNGVTIECLPFDAFIARYDRQGTLFLLDPPYWGSEKDYGAELFDRGCFAALAAQLAGIKGRFLLTINDRPETRKLFGRFKIEAVQTSYSIAGGHKSKRAGELIVEGP